MRKKRNKINVVRVIEKWAYSSTEVDIDNWWLHEQSLLNGKSKWQSWMEEKWRYSFCPTVGATCFRTWLYLKFEVIWWPPRNEFDGVICWLSVPVSCRYQLLIIAKEWLVKIGGRALRLTTERQRSQHLLHKLQIAKADRMSLGESKINQKMMRTTDFKS